MISKGCCLADLPQDLRTLILDFADFYLGEQGVCRASTHRFRLELIPLSSFPRVKMWTDYRDRSYSQAMVGRELPPILRCGRSWLDGRNRVWAARRSGKAYLPGIDLSEIGLCSVSASLGRLRLRSRAAGSDLTRRERSALRKAGTIRRIRGSRHSHSPFSD